MNKILPFLFFFIISNLYAQQPSVKIDLDMQGRRTSEVTEPGYQSWVVSANSNTKTISGVSFVLKGNSIKTSWSKAMVQTPYFARLVNDGVMVEEENNAGLELRISGLPVGIHTLQTYHNIWQNNKGKSFSPINVFLNNKLVHSNIERTVQASKSIESTILFTKLDVRKEGEEMVLLVQPVNDFKPEPGKTAVFNICLNAIELNTVDATKQAQDPFPIDKDVHANADDGSVVLKWKPSLKGNVKAHTLYFGDDSLSVATAKQNDKEYFKGTFNAQQSEYKVEGLTNHKTYYWRIDETNSSGETSPGKVWSFRPRHLAFRGAEGYGRFAIGGRGGKIVEVTNLNDDGPGSFREAITKNIGPRTIIFSVSGIITLKSRLVVKDKYVTIAGQTAPGKGICLRSAPLGIGSETICRFIRSRLGAGKTYDGLGMAGANHSIVDHCSISWTIDEAFSSRNGKNFTLQHCLISEALNIAGHKNYREGSGHGYAATIGGDIGSFHHNLLAHCSGRNWSLGGGLDGNGYYAGKLDIFNNVVYNWGTRATDGGAHQVNFVNNYYKAGAATTLFLTLRAQLEGVGKGTQSYYYSGNILQNPDGTFACDGTNDNCGRTYVASRGQVVDWEVFVEEPFFTSYAEIEPAKDAFKSVLSDVGCNLPIIDDHDKRIIGETLNGTYTYMGSKSQKGGIIDHQDEAGGYEPYPEEKRSDNFDTDHDGLPNWWENLHGSNPNSPIGDFSDSNADKNHDGYTSLEDYLEWMAVPHYFVKQSEKVHIDLSSYLLGYKNPICSYRIGNYQSDTFKSEINIPTDSIKKGINYLKILASDQEKTQKVLIIGVCLK